MRSELEYSDTPSILVDLDKMEANLKELAGIAADAKVGLRPHTKTHKSPELALRQIELGASGITVAKIGEAEVMADAGIHDIRIAYPIIGEQKLSQLGKLMERADISISLDSFEAASGLSALGQHIQKTIPILLKINTGLDRVGVTAPEALDLAKQIAPLPGIDLVGILTHEGQAMHEHSLDGAKRAAREAGTLMVSIAK